MILSKEAIKVLVVNNLFVGKSKQDIEDGIVNLLARKLIDVDDYAFAMELLYGGDDDV